MKSLLKMAELADQFETKLVRTALQSAQSGEIDKALSDAGVRPGPNDLAPYLNAAKVPDTAKVDIGILVDKNLNVKFVTGPSKFPTLESKLNQAYAAKMRSALQQSGLGVADTVTVGLASF